MPERRQPYPASKENGPPSLFDLLRLPQTRLRGCFSQRWCWGWVAWLEGALI